MLIASTLSAQNDKILQSTSSIDWTKNEFTSNVSLDMERAGIEMPSGKTEAVREIDDNIPDLVSPPLFTVAVDSERELGDLIVDKTFSYEEITNLIQNGKRSSAVFANRDSTLSTRHTINLLSIASPMVLHHYTYKPERPVEEVASRVYSGIIIDARGKLPIHGEFQEDRTNPCFFPKIWDKNMNTVYERNMGEPESEKQKGMILYHWSDNENLYRDRIGYDALRINAVELYGRLRTDPVISREDALKILTIPENIELLKQGKVVVLLDKDKLVSKVEVADKSGSYYTIFRELKQKLYNSDENPQITDTLNGIQILYDLKFKADSAELLESEMSKIKDLAFILKDINKDNAFTILVEGHTADVNKPEGQMNLSIARTQTIIRQLVRNGLPQNIFSYRGYGGTQPIADNSTPEGRAQNRRVIITARPKATYIMRK